MHTPKPGISNCTMCLNVSHPLSPQLHTDSFSVVPSVCRSAVLPCALQEHSAWALLKDDSGRPDEAASATAQQAGLLPGEVPFARLPNQLSARIFGAGPPTCLKRRHDWHAWMFAAALKKQWVSWCLYGQMAGMGEQLADVMDTWLGLLGAGDTANT